MRSIKVLRQVAGLTGRELSRRCNVGATYLSHVEAGRVRPSDALTLRIIGEIEAVLNGSGDQSRKVTLEVLDEIRTRVCAQV